MKLNKLQQAIAGVFIILIMAAICNFLILKDKKNQIISTEKSISKLEKDINVAKAIKNQATELEAEMAHLTNQLDRLKKILPTVINKPKFLADMKRYANENGIEILSLVTNRPKIDDVIVEHPFSFRVRGSYHDMGYFFSQLTNYQRIVNVKALELVKSDGDYSTNSKFVLSVFSYREPTEAELRKRLKEEKAALKKQRKKGKKKKRR